MKKFWYCEGVSYDAWMQDKEPDKFSLCEESGPYYLASEVDAFVQRAMELRDAYCDEISTAPCERSTTRYLDNFDAALRAADPTTEGDK